MCIAKERTDGLSRLGIAIRGAARGPLAVRFSHGHYVFGYAAFAVVALATFDEGKCVLRASDAHPPHQPRVARRLTFGMLDANVTDERVRWSWNALRRRRIRGLGCARRRTAQVNLVRAASVCRRSWQKIVDCFTHAVTAVVNRD